MKFRSIILNAFVLSAILACNSHKSSGTHSHDANGNHTHKTVKATKNIDYFGSYQLEDANYGTKTTVTISGNKRIMVTNSLPNHDTGAFPTKGNPNTISAQNKTYTFPVNPMYTGKAQWMREPGIALNGIKFEPQTAEVVECETGENYRVEAIQDVINLGLDFNNAHVQPTGAYHYHGTPNSMIAKFDKGEDLVHIGFAHDGFPMYLSKSGKYKPSFKLLDGNREGEDCVYENPKQTIDVAVGGHHDGTFGSDYEYIENYGDLDECNGITVNGQYMYLVTEEFPYVGRCLMGEVDQEEQRGPRNRQQGNGERPNRVERGKPNASELMNHMDSNKDGKLSKDEVKGPLQQDFSKVDTNNDGFITKEELEKGVKVNRPKRPSQQRLHRR